MYVGMFETRFLKILLNSFHENYSDLFKTTTRYLSITQLSSFLLGDKFKAF